MTKAPRINRRKFGAAASAAFAFTYIPRRVWGANERFYVAGIGVGGKGEGEVKDWKWSQDPKVLLWIIGGLVFVIWVILQRP